tara:strand:+ start:15028 stop:16281 length:1254 start_codon:yes stop_codon:yes gene_type:complete
MIGPAILLLASLGSNGDPAAWIRTANEPEVRSVLEIASRRYEAPSDTTTPDVWLIGVTHIGDAAYYEALTELLADVDVVLYESVMPDGARPHRAATETARRASTRQGLELLATIGGRTEDMPTDAETFAAAAEEIDLRMGNWIRAASTDAWGRPIDYLPVAAGLQLRSAGPDGERATDDDLVVEVVRPTESDEPTPPRNLQAALADALGLRYQLESMPYAARNWRVSDMSIGAIRTAFARRGMEFDMLGDMLSGSSIPAQLINTMLGLIAIGDSLSGGAVSDGVKVVLVELLGTPGVLDMTDRQFGPGFQDVIIVERNTVPLEDLERIIAEEPAIDSVAILYGAAHMPDLAVRLVQSEHGYEEVDVRWDRAIGVDLETSPLTERDRKSIRRSIRLALAGLKREARLAAQSEAASDDE